MTDKEIIPISRYEARLDNGVVRYFAIAGKKEYEMPACYADMYTEEYLAIKERKPLRMPELLIDEDKGETLPAKHFIPLRTV